MIYHDNDAMNVDLEKLSKLNDKHIELQKVDTGDGTEKMLLIKMLK